MHIWSLLDITETLTVTGFSGFVEEAKIELFGNNQGKSGEKKVWLFKQVSLNIKYGGGSVLQRGYFFLQSPWEAC